MRNEHFLDYLKERLGCKNDAQLSVQLDIEPAYVSRIRHDRAKVSANLRIVIHELTGMSFAKMREMLGEPEWRAQ
jgi:hypothetical protein